MEVLTKTELKLRYDEIIEKIKKGALFIHPTDTIYGIGCDASNKDSIEKIRKVKERPDSPFSIWIPSLDWINKNCKTREEYKEWFKELPGSYTFILKLKDKSKIADNINPNKDTIGVRYPDHWFGKIVEDAGIPIVTTSANRHGQPFMTILEDLDPKIELSCEFMIYEGEKKGRPSKIVNLTQKGEITAR